MKFLLFSLCVFLSFTPVSIASDFEFELIGGQPVGVGEYPEVIRISSGMSSCTAAVIGPRVILTAAHCTKQDGEIVPISEEALYEFIHEQQVYKARCSIAPDYRGQTGDQDMALCLSDRRVDLKYASISKEPMVMNEMATLIGYGCIHSEPPRAGNDGVLRVGRASVVREASDSYYSFHTRGSSALCFGDSGGPAFKEVKDAKRDYHYIAGVNSRGNIVDLSLLTSMAHPNSIEWMQRYQFKHGVLICGLGMVCDEESQPSRCDVEMLDLRIAVQRLDMCLAE